MLLPDVKKWRVSALNDFASALAAANNDTFQANIDKPHALFSNLGTAWQGAAHNAAYDRVDADHAQARKVWTYVDDLITEIHSAASDIDSHRTVVLSKVGDAEGAGLRVADNWVVCDKEGVSADIIRSHQDAIDGALRPFYDAVSAAATKIGAAAELVRSAGDLFGSDLDVAAAPAQGGRLGAEDGKLAAEAAQSGDTAKLDDVASRLPTFVVTPEQMQALAAGKDVPTLPAEVQDYYKEFFANAGKDGLLALDDRLTARATVDPGHPADTVAASQQTALATGMLAITNEHLGTGITPDGKLTAPGSYTNLPTDIRQLVSGREQDYIGNNSGPGGMKQRVGERTRFADFLSHAEPAMQGGRTFSTELGRQSQSLAGILDSHPDHMPPGFTEDGDRKSIDDAATKLLGIANRNHDADFQLMTGRDVITGDRLPGDMSFGARGDDYGPRSVYDQKQFADTMFRNHTWGDQGTAAGDLYKWTADHIQDPTHDGDIARKTIAALPDTLEPKDGERLVKAADGSTYFAHTTESFNKNPELANALARVVASDIDAFAGVDTDRHGPKPAVPLELMDSERLAFLASQTQDGRHTIDAARQSYENAMLYQLTHGGGDISAHDTIQKLAGIDAHIKDAQQNALIYQDYHAVAEQNAQAQQSHDNNQQAADMAKKVVDALPLPGGKAVSTIKDLVEEPAYKALMDNINPEPTPGTVQYPSVEKSILTGEQNFRDLFEPVAKDGDHPLSQAEIETHMETYRRQYADIVGSNLVHDNTSVEQLATGGALAPDNKDVNKKGS